ncbi:hypothetical protein GUJ93_ZPchr0006g42505 [Zizania palustris]|uniref:Uncharacterized protein n=1 Tax=Zizania palustris TaxID=103762 RepID=A0A8J5T0I4_ZIZPA|nr:hypothetical protein GUJ93_ZPchr0006g42505 [Zizania palustris]
MDPSPPPEVVIVACGHRRLEPSPPGPLTTTSSPRHLELSPLVAPTASRKLAWSTCCRVESLLGAPTIAGKKPPAPMCDADVRDGRSVVVPEECGGVQEWEVGWRAGMGEAC